MTKNMIFSKCVEPFEVTGTYQLYSLYKAST